MERHKNFKDCVQLEQCENCTPVFSKNSFQINECKRCGHQYAVVKDQLKKHIESHYGDQYFNEGGTGYPDYLQEKDLLLNHGRRYARIIKKYKEPGNILDVGSAAGFILKSFIESGWSGMGIEPNVTMVNYGKEKLGLNMVEATLEDFTTGSRFDLITLIQVVGHIHGLDKSLRNIQKLLKKDGILLVECWDRGSLAARILGKNWHEYSPPTVIHWYTKSSLKNVFAQYGFHAIRFGKPLKKISIRHSLSLLEEKISLKPLRAILKAASKITPKNLNLIYPPLDVFWVIFKYEG